MKQKEDWIHAAVRVLREGGIEAVRVEAIARELGVTKGSFYWHFRDRRELLECLLTLWEEETAWLIREAEAAPDPVARLGRFFEVVTRSTGYPADAAVFAWAGQDPEVAARVAATERRRMEFFTRQLRESGLDGEEAERRGEVAYLATLGWIERAGRVPRMETDLLTFATLLFRMVLDGAPAAEPAWSLNNETETP